MGGIFFFGRGGGKGSIKSSVGSSTCVPAAARPSICMCVSVRVCLCVCVSVWMGGCGGVGASSPWVLKGRAFLRTRRYFFFDQKKAFALKCSVNFTSKSEKKAFKKKEKKTNFLSDD